MKRKDMAFSFDFQIDGQEYSPNLEIIVQPVCHLTAGSGLAPTNLAVEVFSR
jgi:hypothetical protein